MMPVAMMLMLVYVFGGAIDTGSDSYVNYLLSGILLITVASGVASTALRLFIDMKSGIFERFQSPPVARSGVLWAHVVPLKDTVGAQLTGACIQEPEGCADPVGAHRFVALHRVLTDEQVRIAGVRPRSGAGLACHFGPGRHVAQRGGGDEGRAGCAVEGLVVGGVVG